MKNIIVVVVLLVAGMITVTAHAGSCAVMVTWPDGKPHSGIRVVGDVSRGGMTDTFYTDKKGHVMVEWSSDNSLTNVYVDGDKRSGCKNGGGAGFVAD